MNIKGILAQPAVMAIQAAGYLSLRARGHTDWTRSIPGHAYRPEWQDLWYLYRAVRRHKPSLILEFGPGATTRVMAAALADNGHGRIVTIDAHASWLDVARGYFPADLAARVEFVHSPARLIERDGMRVWQHERVPDVVPDMIYLDGPPLDLERGHTVAVDLIDMEPRLRPGCQLVVDGRRDNWLYLQQHMQRQWRWSWSRLEYRGYGELRH